MPRCGAHRRSRAEARAQGVAGPGGQCRGVALPAGEGCRIGPPGAGSILLGTVREVAQLAGPAGSILYPQRIELALAAGHGAPERRPLHGLVASEGRGSGLWRSAGALGARG